MAGGKRRNQTQIAPSTASRQDGTPIAAPGSGGGGGGGTGDVVGPGVAVANDVVVFNGTTGKLVKDSGVLYTDLVQKTRLVSAGSGLTGGGDLSADRTLAADFGSGAGKVTQGNDARLSDARTPTAHATSHKAGGGDAIKLDELAAPTDVTTLNASATAHGLVPKWPNNATTFFRGDGNYAQVALASAVSGTLPVANGGTGTATAFTAGSVVFAGASGVYTQDNAHLFWDDTNNVLGVGTTAPFSSFGPSNFRGAEISDPTSSLFSLTSDGGAAYIFSVFNNTAGSAQGNMYWIRGRGTRASSVKVESEDYIGTILFLGIDVNGSAFGQAAGRIDCVVDGGTGTNDMPGRLMFSTTPDGTASPVERMRITNAGKVGIGTATVPSLLTVNGPINLKNYTVATLPAGTRGDIAYVTDALAPAFLAVLVGGGAVVTPCFYNGANWIGF